MLPSEKLRQNISKKYNINLDEYKWSNSLIKIIFSIHLDPYLETKTKTLEEIYKYGFNIGHCGLTSRYLAIKFPTAKLQYGTCKLLIGTKNAPNGEHSWIIINNHLIDSTLMISIPIDKITKLGYLPLKEIAPDSARILSEYDLYEHEYTSTSNSTITLKKKN